MAGEIGARYASAALGVRRVSEIGHVRAQTASPIVRRGGDSSGIRVADGEGGRRRRRRRVGGGRQSEIAEDVNPTAVTRPFQRAAAKRAEDAIQPARMHPARVAFPSGRPVVEGRLVFGRLGLAAANAAAAVTESVNYDGAVAALKQRTRRGRGSRGSRGSGRRGSPSTPLPAALWLVLLFRQREDDGKAFRRRSDCERRSEDGSSPVGSTCKW